MQRIPPGTQMNTDKKEKIRDYLRLAKSNPRLSAFHSDQNADATDPSGNADEQ